MAVDHLKIVNTLTSQNDDHLADVNKIMADIVKNAEKVQKDPTNKDAKKSMQLLQAKLEDVQKRIEMMKKVNENIKKVSESMAGNIR